MSRKKRDDKISKITKESVITQVCDNTPTFNILYLLKTQKYDSKPNMSKFLNMFVQSVRLCIHSGKIDLWPKVGYTAAKAFIKFKDGHELIKDYTALQNNPTFYLFYNLDEVDIPQHDIQLIEKFFSYMEGFKFIRINSQSVEQMILTDGINKINEKLDEQNKIVESHLLSGDFTPRINCS